MATPVDMAVVFKALGSPTRLRLLAVMQAAPGGAVCVCDLVDAVRLTQTSLSYHIDVLIEAGLVRQERRGAWVWCLLIPESLDPVRELLALPG